MRNSGSLVLLYFFMLATLTFGQHGHRKVDPLHSVFGNPTQPVWKYQLAYSRIGGQNIPSYNLFRENQRGKTFYLSVSDNGLEYTQSYRVTQVTGAVILFPLNNDDRYQLDIGGTHDDIKEVDKSNNTYFSRFTYRPSRKMWFRLGYEAFDGYEAGHGSEPYVETTQNSQYLAGKYNLGTLTPVVLAGTGDTDETNSKIFGAGCFAVGPKNTFIFAGEIQSSESEENVRTIALGRWASFRPDNLPSGLFIWKHKSNYDFQLGALFLGKRNQFVRPAALGMVTGMYISSAALRANSRLRQRKLSPVHDSYQSADYSIYYVHLNQVIFDGSNNVGFTALQFYKHSREFEFSAFSQPALGIFYTQETSPVFNPNSFQFDDEQEQYISYQLSMLLMGKFSAEVLHVPDLEEYTFALSYIFK